MATGRPSIVTSSAASCVVWFSFETSFAASTTPRSTAVIRRKTTTMSTMILSSFFVCSFCSARSSMMDFTSAIENVPLRSVSYRIMYVCVW